MEGPQKPGAAPIVNINIASLMEGIQTGGMKKIEQRLRESADGGASKAGATGENHRIVKSQVLKNQKAKNYHDSEICRQSTWARA